MVEDRQEGPSERHSRSPAGRAFAAAVLGAFLLALPAAVEAQDPPERVELNGRLYDMPAPWAGNRITEIADRAALVRLPGELTGDSRIYVTPDTRRALVALAGAARKQGIRLEVDSGFRSRGFQKRILENRLAEGRPFLDAIRWTAPPGYSEHQTGRAVDFVPSDADFKDTPAYQWLKKHAADFCFTESYPQGNAAGFEWEPWHWRHDCGGAASPLRPAWNRAGKQESANGRSALGWAAGDTQP